MQNDSSENRKARQWHHAIFQPRHLGTSWYRKRYKANIADHQCSAYPAMVMVKVLGGVGVVVVKTGSNKYNKQRAV